MDTLEITGLKTQTQIGIHPWEQQIKQPLLIDLQIAYDCSECQDDLSRSIDYAELCATIKAFVEANAFHLIETVGEKIAALIKEQFPVTKLTIRVSKPNAIAYAANVSVTLTR